MTINFKTASHINGVLVHAARSIRNGGTLKAAREYLFYQLVTRVESGEVDGADVGHCSGAYALQGILRSKADFLAHCDRESAYWDELAKEAISAQRAEKERRESAPAPEDLTADRLAAPKKIILKNLRVSYTELRDPKSPPAALKWGAALLMTPLEVIDMATAILEHFGVAVNLREHAPEDPTVKDAAAVVHVATQALQAWNDGDISTSCASCPGDVIASWVENMQDLNEMPLPSGPYDLSALARAAEAVRPAPAQEATPITVICMTDTREWDEPLTLFIDVLTPGDVRAAVEAEYNKTMGDWEQDGGVILGIMRGHIQIGWSGYNGGYGVPDDMIADAFDNFGVTAK